MSRKVKRVKGILTKTKKGYGFVQVAGKTLFADDIFIPKKYISGAIDRDLVEVKIKPSFEKGKGLEGEIVKILKRGRNYLCGIVIGKYKGLYMVYLPSLDEDRVAEVKSKQSLKNGDRIKIKVTDWTNEYSPLLGVLEKFIGNIKDPSKDMDFFIEEFGLQKTFSKKALLEAEELKKKFSKTVFKKRRDLTDLETITIDPTTSKDFDDSISLTRDKKGFYLGVHIADVAHFVKQNSHLGKDAFKRCNSTYFPGSVIPMLPKILSNDLCSLKEGVIRLTVSVMMDFDKKGNLLSYEIFRSFIENKKRFTYEEAFKILEGKSKSSHSEMLKNMKELCLLLKKKRFDRGSIDFAIPEAVLEVDDKGNPKDIKIVEYDISHQIVEEFMLKANETVAKHLNKKKKNLIYRVHESPSKKTFEDFYMFARMLGFKLPSSPTTSDIQKLFLEAKNTDFLDRLSINFIRSMKMALYSEENIGHFGLSLKHYCHFTSPIRRYSDLIVQRLLFDEIERSVNLKKIAKEVSLKERTSFRAETSLVLLKKLRLLNKFFKEKPSKKYEALVTKVTPHFLHFEIKKFFLEGSLHVSEISFSGDYFIYDPATLTLEGEETGESFSYGDTMYVSVREIDLISCKVEWEVA
jgi:ribonuclease R